MSGFEDGFPYSDLQFNDQVDQIDHEMFQDEYRECQAQKPKVFTLEITDEDELMEIERDCE